MRGGLIHGGQTGTTLDLASAIRRGRRDCHGTGREQPASTQTWQGTREAGEDDEPDRQILWGRLGSQKTRCTRAANKGRRGGRTAQRNQAEENRGDEWRRRLALNLERGACLDVKERRAGLWIESSSPGRDPNTGASVLPKREWEAPAKIKPGCACLGLRRLLAFRLGLPRGCVDGTQRLSLIPTSVVAIVRKQRRGRVRGQNLNETWEETAWYYDAGMWPRSRSARGSCRQPSVISRAALGLDKVTSKSEQPFCQPVRDIFDLLRWMDVLS
ncbi:hypothetical protein B0T20DRAFT_465501 [Sordaria brevicollis]|uniref:Uncharacterized protein n=1 Tax=Sordaria brevicollis TaxID=83679 RepID=A0AAE0PMC4_SORBR|nr:hypothetical protein B0T20DRAFT_465501 [Sordaria brevicollis]